MHTVRNPFYSRVGQFSEGQDLAIGVSYDVLIKKDVFEFKIGKNPKVYRADANYILNYATKLKSIWRNKKGKKVAIVPIKIFEKEDKE